MTALNVWEAVGFGLVIFFVASSAMLWAGLKVPSSKFQVPRISPVNIVPAADGGGPAVPEGVAPDASYAAGPTLPPGAAGETSAPRADRAERSLLIEQIVRHRGPDRILRTTLEDMTTPDLRRCWDEMVAVIEEGRVDAYLAERSACARL